MQVYYRITSIPSTNPSPIYQEDKDELNEVCLKSFVKGFEDVNPKVTFIADYCTPRTIGMIDEICPFQKEVLPTHMGINNTAILQFNMARESLEDEIFYGECDYMYQPKIGKKMVSAIQELDLVSPYDHLNYYLSKEHSDIVVLKLVDDVHFRSVENATMTFGIKTSLFKETVDIWKRYGYLDKENWKEMRELGHLLFVPIPSFATHMCKSYMAPSIEWQYE
jgi:hypothetical protein